MNIDVNKIKRLLNIIVNDYRDELEEAKVSFNIISKLVDNSEIDFIKIDSLSDEEKSSFIADTFPDYNETEVIKLVKIYKKFIEANKPILLSSPQFKIREAKVEELKVIIKARIENIDRELGIINKKIEDINIVRSIIDKDFTNLNDLNVEKIVSIIEGLDVSSNEKTEIMSLVFRTVSDEYQARVARKENEIIEIIEQRRQEAKQKRLKQRTEVIPEEQKINNILDDIINGNEELKAYIEENEISVEDLFNTVYLTLLVSSSEQGLNIEDLAREIGEELILDYLREEIERLSLARYRRIIAEDSGISLFIKNNLVEEDVINRCLEDNVGFNPDAVLEEVEKIYLENIKHIKYTCDMVFETAKILIENSKVDAKKIFEEKGFDISDEVIEGIVNIFNENKLSVSKIEIYQNTINQLYDNLKKNIRIVYKYNAGISTDEESEKYVEELCFAITSFRSLKDTEDLIYPEAKNVPTPKDFYEAILLIFADKNINSYIDKNIQKNALGITNPFSRILFLSPVADNVDDTTLVNYYSAIARGLKLLEELPEYNERALDAHAFSETNPSKVSKYLASKDVIVCRPGDARIFIRRAVFRNENDEPIDRYVVIFIDKKMQNGTSDKQNEKNCMRAIKTNLTEFDRLVELIKNDEYYLDEEGNIVSPNAKVSKTRHTFEEELEKQKELANRACITFNVSLGRGI